MNPSSKPHSHRLSWAVFLVALLLASLFVNQTWRRLPLQVAVHFDDAGVPSSFVAATQYRILILLFAVLLPIVLVSIMTSAYSRAHNLKLPNRDYWLASQRLDRTRSFLIGHGIWFGTLLVGFMSFMHWLILDANQQLPPQLSNQALFYGLLVLLGCMIAWLGTLLAAFRRPRLR